VRGWASSASATAAAATATPESQAFIESWFGKLKQREVWLNEYETLDDARRAIGGYVDRYHHRPHSRLDYKTPYEVKETREDLQNIAA
jgi:putative transposase